MSVGDSPDPHVVALGFVRALAQFGAGPNSVVVDPVPGHLG